jgi:hypothetical protein
MGKGGKRGKGEEGKGGKGRGLALLSLFPLTLSLTLSLFSIFPLKTFAEQVGHLDKEGSAVAAEAWLKSA